MGPHKADLVFLSHSQQSHFKLLFIYLCAHACHGEYAEVTVQLSFHPVDSGEEI